MHPYPCNEDWRFFSIPWTPLDFNMLNSAHKSEIFKVIKIDDSFQYLGGFFDFEMSEGIHLSKLLSIFSTFLKEIDDLPLHPKNKLLVNLKFVLFKVSWHFTVTKVPKFGSRIILIILYPNIFTDGLTLPVSSTLSSIVLSETQFDLNPKLPSCQIHPMSNYFTKCT